MVSQRDATEQACVSIFNLLFLVVLQLLHFLLENTISSGTLCILAFDTVTSCSYGVHCWPLGHPCERDLNVLYEEEEGEEEQDRDQ